MRLKLFKPLLLILVLILVNCQSELQFPKNSSLEIKLNFSKEIISKNIPFEFEVNWDSYTSGFLEDLNNNYLEFDLVAILEKTNQSEPAPNKFITTYKLLVTSLDNNSYNFYTVKYLQRPTQEHFTRDISNPIGFSGKIYLSDTSNELVISKKYNNGNFEGYINQFSQAEYEKNTESDRMQLGCYFEKTYHYTDWYQLNYYSNGGWSWTYLDSDLIGVTFEQICEGCGGGGDSGPTGGGGSGTYYGNGGGAYEDCEDPVHPCFYEVTDDTMTPCDHAKSLVNDQSFIGKMNDLKTKTSLDYEVGYTMTKDSNGEYSYNSLTGNPNEAGINFTVNTAIDGYIHTHYTGLLSIFSPDDIRALSNLYNAGLINNFSTFTAGVVTSNGTTYILMIENNSMFETFSQTYLQDDISFNLFANIYDGVYQISPTNTATNNEIGFLQLLKNSNSGLKLLKGDPATFNNWKQQGLDQSNNVTSTNCN